jgi:5-methylcytosine-specific restriction endonuclease McrA
MTKKKKDSKFIPLPTGAISFLKLFKESETYKKVPAELKGIVTQSIRRRGALNNKHLRLLQQAVKYKGIVNILDTRDPRLTCQPKIQKKNFIDSETRVSKENSTAKVISDYPFDIHWTPPRGKTPKENHDIYIKSDVWKRKRNYILSKRGNKCQDPNCEKPIVSKSKLHCHHLTYKRFGCEEENDLQILCEPCHDKVHREHTIQAIQERFETSNYWNGIEIK